MPSECNGTKDSVLDTKLSSLFISFVCTSSKKSRGGTSMALRKPDSQEVLRGDTKQNPRKQQKSSLHCHIPLSALQHKHTALQEGSLAQGSAEGSGNCEKFMAS